MGTEVPRMELAAKLVQRDAPGGLLAVALSSPGAVVLVEGEAGIGKTRLVHEVLARVPLADATTYVGHCYPSGSPRPCSRSWRRCAVPVRSTDGGRTFAPLVGSAALRPVRLVADRTDPLVLAAVVAIGPQHRLVVSPDGGTTFRPVTDTDIVDDLDVAGLPGGGSALLAAGPAGLVLSSNHGATWQQVARGAFSNVRFESSSGSALMAVRESRLVRSPDTGVTTKPAEDGLPPCGSAPALVGRTLDVPAMFVARCGARYYGFRADGSDLDRVDSGSGDSPDEGVSGATNTALVPTRIDVYRTWPLPHTESKDDSGTTSASLAWDGETLYYTPGESLDQDGCDTAYANLQPCPGSTPLHRLDPRTGRYLGALRIPVPNVRTLSYDARRGVFYVGDPISVYRFDPRTGRASKLFDTQHYAVQNIFSSYATFVYDPAIDRWSARPCHAAPRPARACASPGPPTLPTPPAAPSGAGRPSSSCARTAPQGSAGAARGCRCSKRRPGPRPRRGRH